MTLALDWGLGRKLNRERNHIALQYFGSNSFISTKTGMTSKWPVVWKSASFSRNATQWIGTPLFLKCCLEGSSPLIENGTFLDTFFTASAKSLSFLYKNKWKCNYFWECCLCCKSHSFSGMKQIVSHIDCSMLLSISLLDNKAHAEVA